MKRFILCLLVVLCWSSFALSTLVEDPDFIDEKGKALKNFKGKCICALSLPQNYLRLVILIKRRNIITLSVVENTNLRSWSHFTCGSMSNHRALSSFKLKRVVSCFDCQIRKKFLAKVRSQ